MDIQRPELKLAKRRRQWLWAGSTALLASVAGLGIARMGPAIPTVARSTLVIGSVERGEMLREVRGPGTLVPREIRWIAAETAARVERIAAKPGARVEPGSLILELANPEVDEQLLAATSALTAARSDAAARRTDLNSRLYDAQAALELARSGFEAARMQAEAEKDVAEKGIIPAVQYRRSLVVLEQLRKRVVIEERRVFEFERSVAAQVAGEQARLDQLEATRALRQRQVDALRVRAGISGILQQVPVEEGQQVVAGANLARVAKPDELMANLRIPETQATDVAIGQPATIDTRNGVVEGRVLRVDPAVQAGSVLVDVELVGTLPAGARPDLSVDGTITIERLPDVLHMRRPAFAQPAGTQHVFRLDPEGAIATRVPVRLGRLSVDKVEVRQGLGAGDRVVLSDTDAWDRHERIRLE